MIEYSGCANARLQCCNRLPAAHLRGLPAGASTDGGMAAGVSGHAHYRRWLAQGSSWELGWLVAPREPRLLMPPLLGCSPPSEPSWLAPPALPPPPLPADPPPHHVEFWKGLTGPGDATAGVAAAVAALGCMPWDQAELANGLSAAWLRPATLPAWVPLPLEPLPPVACQTERDGDGMSLAQADVPPELGRVLTAAAGRPAAQGDPANRPPLPLLPAPPLPPCMGPPVAQADPANRPPLPLPSLPCPDALPCALLPSDARPRQAATGMPSKRAPGWVGEGTRPLPPVLLAGPPTGMPLRLAAALPPAWLPSAGVLPAFQTEEAWGRAPARTRLAPLPLVPSPSLLVAALKAELSLPARRLWPGKPASRPCRICEAGGVEGGRCRGKVDQRCKPGDLRSSP